MSPNTGSIWRKRSFVLLLCAYGISAFGDHLSEVAIMKEMGIDVGGDKTRVGALMLFFFFLPYVVLGPLAGVVADRCPRRAIMVVADVVRAAIAASIPWYFAGFQDRGSIGMLMPVLALGVFASFFNPARQAMVPQIVRGDRLTRANSVLNGIPPIASIVSYLAGGMLVGAGLTQWNFFGDAATFVASAALILSMRIPAEVRAAATRRRDVWSDVPDAVRYIATHRFVWQLTLFTVAFWTAAGAFSSVMPTVVFDWYHLKYRSLGVFRANLGLGMLIGAAVLSAVGEASRPHYNIIAALLGVGAMLGLFAFTTVPWIGGVFSVGVGLFGVWLLISANTLLQRILPNRVRGRVFGIVDLSNMTGMLAATGLLGIWPLPNIDAWVRVILGVMAAALAFMGVVVCRHHARRTPHAAALSLLRCVNEVLCKGWHRLRREGICRIPPQGPCIIASNHVSSADPCYLIASSPNRVFGFMIAREYYELPIWRHVIAYLGCIPVRRDGHDVAAAREALRELRRGRAIGIFIQGRIPGPGRHGELHEGAAALALRAGVAVIPVHISGVKYDDSIVRPFLRRHRVRIKYGPAVDLGAYSNPKDRDQVAAATRAIWGAIEALAPPDTALYIEPGKGAAAVV